MRTVEYQCDFGLLHTCDNRQKARERERGKNNGQRQHRRSATKNPKISKRKSHRSSSNLKNSKALHRHRECVFLYARPTHSHARISLERDHLCGECVWKWSKRKRMHREEEIVQWQTAGKRYSIANDGEMSHEPTIDRTNSHEANANYLFLFTHGPRQVASGERQRN